MTVRLLFWGQELASSKQLKEDIALCSMESISMKQLTPAKVGKISGAAINNDEYLYRDYLKRFGLPLDKEIKTLSKA